MDSSLAHYVKTLNFILVPKFFCLVFLITWKIMCEKLGNGFGWELEYFGFQIYLCENRLLTIGKTLNFNSLLKVFQRLDFKNFFCLVFFIMTNYVWKNWKWIWVGIRVFRISNLPLWKQPINYKYNTEFQFIAKSFTALRFQKFILLSLSHNMKNYVWKNWKWI